MFLFVNIVHETSKETTSDGVGYKYIEIITFSIYSHVCMHVHANNNGGRKYQEMAIEGRTLY